MKKISIVVPCYNEEETVEIFYNEVSKVEKKIKNVCFEIIYIDDGSTDKTLEKIRRLSKNKNVRYCSFSRNFGKEAAMYAGLKKATGDYIAIMDVDLQDPPFLIKEMFEILENTEYDCVATRRVSRKGEPRIRSFFARRFYGLMKKISKRVQTTVHECMKQNKFIWLDADPLLDWDGKSDNRGEKRPIGRIKVLLFA